VRQSLSEAFLHPITWPAPAARMERSEMREWRSRMSP
jgi:hypothetical protein